MFYVHSVVQDRKDRIKMILDIMNYLRSSLLEIAIKIDRASAVAKAHEHLEEIREEAEDANCDDPSFVYDEPTQEDVDNLIDDYVNMEYGKGMQELICSRSLGVFSSRHHRKRELGASDVCPKLSTTEQRLRSEAKTLITTVVQPLLDRDRELPGYPNRSVGQRHRDRVRQWVQLGEALRIIPVEPRAPNVVQRQHVVVRVRIKKKRHQRRSAQQAKKKNYKKKAMF